jgi:FkbM family methyltransferase
MNILKRILNIHRIPIKLWLGYLRFIFLKIIGKDLNNTYLEWINSYLITLTASNSIQIRELQNSFICYSRQFNYKFIIRKFPSSDILVCNQIFGINIEYKYISDIYDKYITTGGEMCIIDAGANVGYTTLYFRHRYKNAKIISIEPEESNYSTLVENINLNKIKNVSLLKNALWYEKTTLQINLKNLKEWSFNVSEINSNNTQEYQNINSITINEIMADNNINTIDILKIDIEGAEEQLLTTIEKCKETIYAAKVIAIEIHDQGNKKEKMIENIMSLGFNISHHGELTIGVNKNFIS